MNYLITPPSTHYDGGLGITACNFSHAADTLKEHGGMLDGLLPLYYLQRHSIELFIKSLIFILHKKYQIPFGDDFDLSNPAIFTNGRWVKMASTHNISDLYRHFELTYESIKKHLPDTTCWEFPNDINEKINLVSGTDPKSTYFRYPESTNKAQDEKKTQIQKMDLEKTLKNIDSAKKPIKCVLMLDENDNLVQAYDLKVDSLETIKIALDYLCEFFYGVHAAFRAVLTNGS